MVRPCPGFRRLVETLSIRLLTQAMPVASIWHVGAHAAPNLSSDDWLQDWKVLGSGQDATGKKKTGQVDWGTPGGAGASLQGLMAIPWYALTKEHLCLPWTAQAPIDAVAVRKGQGHMSTLVRRPFPHQALPKPPLHTI